METLKCLYCDEQKQIGCLYKHMKICVDGPDKNIRNCLEKLNKKIEKIQEEIDYLNAKKTGKVIEFFYRIINENFIERMIPRHKIHLDVNFWDKLYRSIGNVVIDNIKDCREDLRIYFLGDYNNDMKIDIVNTLEGFNIKCYEFIEIDNTITCICLNTKETEFVYNL